MYGESDVEIYATQPEGFVDEQFPAKVLHLNKSLYGLKQAPSISYLFLCGVVSELGSVALEKRIPAFVFEGTSFSQSRSTVFKWLVQQKKTTVMQYTKNWRSTSKSSIKALSGAFWASTSSGIGMTTSSLLIRAPDRLLGELGVLTNAKSAGSPLDPSLPLLAAMPGDKMTNVQYQILSDTYRSLNYLAVFTRPDISFVVSKLSQFNSNPTTSHLKAAMHVLRYLKGTRNLCIVYKP